MSSDKGTSSEITFAQALYAAAHQEMEADPSVFVFGLGVDDPKGMYGTTINLHKDFGPERNFDTPLSEDAMTGVAVGAALAGMRPIHVHQRMDFLLLCMNQLVNMASKMSYMFSGHYSVPLVIRAIIGRSWGQGAQHSQAFHSYFMHVPGLKVFAPTTPFDAKGAMVAAIRDNNPVVFMEHRMLYRHRGHVPDQLYEVPFGKARVLTEGSDITIVGISHMVVECLRACHLLVEHNSSADVIDPVSLAPLDIETIEKSVCKTGRLLVVDNGWLPCGASSEIITSIVERLGTKSIQISRFGYVNTPCPTTKTLENIYYPNAKTIALRANQMIRGSGDSWDPVYKESQEITEFKGPF